LVLTLACRQDMHDQAKYEPYEASPFYANGMSSRQPPAHAVARGFLRDDVEFYTGLTAAGQPVPAFPLATLRGQWPGGAEMGDEEFLGSVLRRGEQRFGMFCTPCHGRVGFGDGMIVQRGFQQPTSFHEERLRNALPGYFVNVMTEGFGQMSSYAAQVTPADRWAIATYIRALQLSQHARLTELPGDVSQDFEAALSAAAKKPEPGGHGAEASSDTGHSDLGHSGEQ
jgi:mono/diheme cytochrome c family protein